MSKQKLSDKQIAEQKHQHLMQQIGKWCSFYRANPHRFCADYLNIRLKTFQKILICMMNLCHYFMYIAARGQGKSFLTAIFCVVRCILYPGTKICIASGKRKQAIEVLEKITTILMPNSANLRAEIKKVQISQADAYIEFHNTSRIKVVTATDTGRGNRANILICDEFRMVPIVIINTVLRKFLTAPRSPKYLDKPQYKHLAERNKEIYLSSAWFKSHWSFEKAKSYCANLVDDAKKYFICGLPYQLSIKENLLSKEQVADEMSESDFNEMTWEMEMSCLWWGDTEGSLFTYESISQNRKLKNSVYPPYICPSLSGKLKIPELSLNERRILSCDVALMASKKHDNDAASIYINSALPTAGGKYVGNLIYTENHEGLLTSELALVIRRLFDIYHCTDIALDVKGIGLGVFDALCQPIHDPENNITYPPLNCCNDPAYMERCPDKNAPKVIWAIQGSSQFNNDMYLALREGFKQEKINLLISELEVDEVLKEIKGYSSLSPVEQTKLQLPYIHTTLLINELINLEYEVKGVNIKVHEKSGMRKDRVSSVGYNYWVQQQIESQYLKKSTNKNLDPSQLVQIRTPQLYKYGKR